MRPVLPILFALVTLAVSARADLRERPPEYGRPILPFDQRVWVKAAEIMDEQTIGADFVLKGETVTNWTEKISVKMLPDRQRVLPRDYLVTLLQALDKISGGEADVHIVSEGDYGLLYSWKLRDQKGRADFDQLSVIIPGKHALHLVSYTRKGRNWPLADRNIWIKRMKKITLKFPK